MCVERNFLSLLNNSNYKYHENKNTALTMEPLTPASKQATTTTKKTQQHTNNEAAHFVYAQVVCCGKSHVTLFRVFCFAFPVHINRSMYLFQDVHSERLRKKRSFPAEPDYIIATNIKRTVAQMKSTYKDRI